MRRTAVSAAGLWRRHAVGQPTRCLASSSSTAATASVTDTPVAACPNLPDFSDTKVAFASKSNMDLVRGWCVLMLSHEMIIKQADKLLYLSRKILGTRITNILVRETFFRHFCAGETEQEALKVMAKLKTFGVGGILDFAAEGDLTDMTTKDNDIALSREYEYESELLCDQHMREFEECVAVAGKGGFAAVKVTALGDAATIRKVAQCVTEIHDLFERLQAETDVSHTLSREKFKKIYSKYFMDDGTGGKRLFECILESARLRFNNDPDSMNDEIDVWEWLSFVTPKEFVSFSKLLKDPPKHFNWTVEDSDKMDRMIGRLDRIARKASDLGVRIMIDAEHTYFQPAIDALTLELQRRHNKEVSVVFGTYQAYLKDATTRLAFALGAAKREQWAFACKVVRGAYMVRERALALEEGRPSPIHDTIEDTAKCYRDCCELILKSTERTKLVVASHNKESSLEVLEMMNQYNRKEGTVSFAQLYGMADTLSFGLAAKGHPVYKYLPFGRVDLVMPYLVRRAQENSSVTEAAKQEMKLISKEIRRRLLAREF